MYLIGRKLDPARSKKERKIFIQILIGRILFSILMIVMIWGIVSDHNDRTSCAKALKQSNFLYDRDGCYGFALTTGNKACLNIGCDI